MSLSLASHKFGAFAVSRVVGQQPGVMLEMRAAAAGVADDGVELFRRELIDVLARQFPRQAQFAVVRVQRAAAMLPGGVTTSQPLRASTSAVSRLTSLNIKSCAQPVSKATRYFFAPAAGVTAEISCGGKNAAEWPASSPPIPASAAEKVSRRRDCRRTSVAVPTADKAG